MSVKWANSCKYGLDYNTQMSAIITVTITISTH